MPLLFPFSLFFHVCSQMILLHTPTPYRWMVMFGYELWWTKCKTSREKLASDPLESGKEERIHEENVCEVLLFYWFDEKKVEEKRGGTFLRIFRCHWNIFTLRLILMVSCHGHTSKKLRRISPEEEEMREMWGKEHGTERMRIMMSEWMVSIFMVGREVRCRQLLHWEWTKAVKGDSRNCDCRWSCLSQAPHRSQDSSLLTWFNEFCCSSSSASSSSWSEEEDHDSSRYEKRRLD